MLGFKNVKSVSRAAHSNVHQIRFVVSLNVNEHNYRVFKSFKSLDGRISNVIAIGQNRINLVLFELRCNRILKLKCLKQSYRLFIDA